MSHLGDHFSPDLQRIIEEAEDQLENINPDTPAPTSVSRSLQEAFLETLKENDESHETEDLDLQAPPMTTTLQDLLSVLQSEDGKAQLEALGIDTGTLEERLSGPPTSTAPTPLKPVVCDATSPRRRSKGRRDSMKILQSSAIKQNNKLSAKTDDGTLFAETTSTSNLGTLASESVSEIMIDGRVLKVSPTPDLDLAKAPVRLYDKLTRSQMDSRNRRDFSTSVTSHVLQKNNKLALFSTNTKSEETSAVNRIRNLDTQLARLKSHFERHDVVDVTSIVTPVEVATSSALVSPIVLFDLFADYHTIHPTQVANSNAWYNLYCSEPYIKENMTYVFECLQQNTELTLWEHCLTLYQQYSLVQRGGPLMLVLILKEIQDSSENAVRHLLEQFKELKISKIQGENVNEAVIQIRSTYDTLVAASTDTCNYVPSDFCQSVLAILQTTSNAEFNKTFEDELNGVTNEAFRHGTSPEWPPMEELFTLARNKYKSLTLTNKWNVPKKPASYNVSDGTQQPFWLRDGYECFNCGKKCGFPLDKCPAPRDEARIEAKRKAHRAKKAAQRSGSSRPRHMVARDGKHKGRPLVLNKKGVYVIDSAKEHRAKIAAESDEAKSLVESFVLHQQAQASNSTDSSTAPPSESTSNTPKPKQVSFSAVLGALKKIR